MHILIPYIEENMQSYETIDTKLRGVALTGGIHCLYIEGEKVHNVEKMTKNDLIITSKSHAHPHIIT